MLLTRRRDVRPQDCRSFGFLDLDIAAATVCSGSGPAEHIDPHQLPTPLSPFAGGPFFSQHQHQHQPDPAAGLASPWADASGSADDELMALCAPFFHDLTTALGSPVSPAASIVFPPPALAHSPLFQHFDASLPSPLLSNTSTSAPQPASLPASPHVIPSSSIPSSLFDDFVQEHDAHFRRTSLSSSASPPTLPFGLHPCFFNDAAPQVPPPSPPTMMMPPLGARRNSEPALPFLGRLASPTSSPTFAPSSILPAGRTVKARRYSTSCISSAAPYFVPPASLSLADFKPEPASPSMTQQDVLTTPPRRTSEAPSCATVDEEAGEYDSDDAFEPEDSYQHHRANAAAPPSPVASSAPTSPAHYTVKPDPSASPVPAPAATKKRAGKSTRRPRRSVNADDDESDDETATSRRRRGSGSGPRMHTCPYKDCGKQFPRRYNLNSHVLCHTGERPHGCTECGARFARRHDLQRHLRTLHAEDRPFKCERCNQAFSKADQLARHQALEDQAKAVAEATGAKVAMVNGAAAVGRKSTFFI
ncbi:hypothetical protein HK101_003072 [Irineochytrium annulatum]|nr:hypothetical protein HK101_003072 [Irineochytrium annulatum]